MENEIWKPISDLPGYEVSNYGRVKKLGGASKATSRKFLPDRKEKIYVIKKCPKGYSRVTIIISGVKYYRLVHRLVAFAFIPLVDGKTHVNHIDGNKANNHYLNLEWCTPAENNKHAIETGLWKNTNSKIPLDQRQFIIDNFFTVGRKKLAEMFGLTDKYILNVVKVKLRGTDQVKKVPAKAKEIIDTQTGVAYTSQTLSEVLGISRKKICRIINEERCANTSPYRYSGRYIVVSR